MEHWRVRRTKEWRIIPEEKAGDARGNEELGMEGWCRGWMGEDVGEGLKLLLP